MRDDKNILNQIKQSVLKVDSCAEVILFGSRARGDCKENSDWDVLILTVNDDNLNTRKTFIDVLLEVQLRNKIVVNFILKNKERWKQLVNTDLYQNIEEDGVLL